VPVSLKAREAQRGLDAERDAIVRQLNAARDAGDRDREEELLDELANIDFDETREEPTTLTEEQEQERREASGINDGIDARSIPRANVRDTFNPSRIAAGGVASPLPLAAPAIASPGRVTQLLEGPATIRRT
jgi:hypothetical protein